MAGSVNKVILVGNLGRDPEVRNTQTGSRIVNFTLATSDSWKDRQTGERRERTEWHRVVVFNPNLADIAERYLRKGSKVYVEGALQTRKWTGNDGQDRYTTEVVLQNFRGELTLLDSRHAGGGGTGGAGGDGPPGGFAGGSESAGGRSPGGGGGAGWDAPPPVDLDDEIPF